MTPTDLKPGDIETILFNSPIYGGLYVGDYLPVQRWQWPKQTWLSRRLEEIRGERGPETMGKEQGDGR